MRSLIQIGLCWVVIYTAVTFMLLGFQWADLNLPVPLQTLVLAVVLVPNMVLFIGPLTARWARSLARQEPEAPSALPHASPERSSS